MFIKVNKDDNKNKGKQIIWSDKRALINIEYEHLYTECLILTYLIIKQLYYALLFWYNQYSKNLYAKNGHTDLLVLLIIEFLYFLQITIYLTTSQK